MCYIFVIFRSIRLWVWSRYLGSKTTKLWKQYKGAHTVTFTPQLVFFFPKKFWILKILVKYFKYIYLRFIKERFCNSWIFRSLIFNNTYQFIKDVNWKFILLLLKFEVNFCIIFIWHMKHVITFCDILFIKGTTVRARTEGGHC